MSQTNILRALCRNIQKKDQLLQLSFAEYLQSVGGQPVQHLRTIQQIFFDMVRKHLGKGENEYPDDPENINYLRYNADELFVKGADQPFFADRPLANRIVSKFAEFRMGSGQNKMYVFEGPPGSGKSTLLNNSLRQLAHYVRTEEGVSYELTWALDKDDIRKKLGKEVVAEAGETKSLLVPCPSHDHPFLLIPKAHRRDLLEELITDKNLRKAIFEEKQYEWIFKREPCTICQSLYETLLEILGEPEQVFRMAKAKRLLFNRRLGYGISVFNAGDPPAKEQVIANQAIQTELDKLFQDSSRVRYVHSRYASTNNGVCVVMDVKDYNINRYFSLFGIVSEEVHKVGGEIEENVHTLFFVVMNPGDEEEARRTGGRKGEGEIRKKLDKAFEDRKVPITVPYVLDYNAEINIYKKELGAGIESHFLPDVLRAFAKAVISTRLEAPSAPLQNWIGNSRGYDHFCDPGYQLLRMDIYAGLIPDWLSEEDRRKFTAKVRREVIAASEKEGSKGFTGRDSINAFRGFTQLHLRNGKLVTMGQVVEYFRKNPGDFNVKVEPGFLSKLKDHYDYNVVQQVKESLYDYNDQRIRADINNYLFALNYEGESGAEIKNPSTGDMIKVSDDFFDGLETRIYGLRPPRWSSSQRVKVHQRFVSQTVTQEMNIDGKSLEETELFLELYRSYVYNLKADVMAPLIKNENFRRAIREFGTEAFKAHDKKIQRDVTLLFKKLKDKGYTEQGAQEICIYVIDSDLATKYK